MSDKINNLIGNEVNLNKHRCKIICLFQISLFTWRIRRTHVKIGTMWNVKSAIFAVFIWKIRKKTTNLCTHK